MLHALNCPWEICGCLRSYHFFNIFKSRNHKCVSCSLLRNLITRLHPKILPKLQKNFKKAFPGQPAASECTLINGCYNIASRATQSNSVYVSVFKISIVHAHAEGMSKSLSQNIFFARAALVSAGGNIIFRYNNGYKQSFLPLVAKRRQFFLMG